MFNIRCKALLTQLNKFQLSSLMFVNNLYSLRNTVINNGFIIQAVSSSHFHISAETSTIQLLAAAGLESSLSRWFFTRVEKKKSNVEAKIKDLLCKICRKTFTTLSGLERHSQHRTGNYSYFCDQCRKGFVAKSNYSSRQNLQYHMSEHTGRYRFTCGICGKGLMRKVCEAW